AEGHRVVRGARPVLFRTESEPESLVETPRALQVAAATHSVCERRHVIHERSRSAPPNVPAFSRGRQREAAPRPTVGDRRLPRPVGQRGLDEAPRTVSGKGYSSGNLRKMPSGSTESANSWKSMFASERLF